MEQFIVPPGDALAAEHQIVSTWVEAACATLPVEQWFKDVEMKSLPAGQAVLDAQPPTACKLVVAAVRQARHWEGVALHRRGARARIPTGARRSSSVDAR